MGRTGEQHRTGYWRSVVLYGLVLAGIVLLLKFVEYKFWIRDLRVEMYVGLVAVLFTALGIWVGKKLLEGRRKEAPAAPQQVSNEEAIRAWCISGRELDVLRLMAQGFSNLEIADRLFISLPTVKSHSSSLFAKLDVSRRTQAVHKAKEAGILP